MLRVFEDDMLDELIEWLGWRPFLKKGAPSAVLRDEFKRQILAMRVLRECMYPLFLTPQKKKKLFW